MLVYSLTFYANCVKEVCERVAHVLSGFCMVGELAKGLCTVVPFQYLPASHGTGSQGSALLPLIGGF